MRRWFLLVLILALVTAAPAAAAGAAPTWTKAAGWHGGATYVSCVSKSFCAGVVWNTATHVPDTSVFNGQHWSSLQPLPGADITSDDSPVVESISCSSRNFCLLVGNTQVPDNQHAYSSEGQGFYATFDGQTWSPAQQSGSLQVDNVSCLSATLCYGVARDNQWRSIAVFNGHNWRTTQARTDVYYSAISCANARFCVAVGKVGSPGTEQDPGIATAFNGRSWSKLVRMSNPSGLEAVDCPRTGFCLAVDHIGGARTFNGHAWSRRQSVPLGGPHPTFLGSVTCASSHFCLVGGDAGSTDVGWAIPFNGHAWGRTSRVNAHDPVWSNTFSCPSAYFCVGGGTGDIWASRNQNNFVSTKRRG